MHCNHRCYECHIPACPDRVRQSIGPRIVPMFADPPEWSADKVYSPLTLVIHNGATYMSRRCVPANTALPDTDPFYNESWVMVYDMNAQVAQYREEVAKLSQQVTAFGCKIDNWEQLIVQWTALIQGWQNQFPELTKALAAITERVAAIEPKLDQAQKDIAALQATQQTHTEQIAANTQGLADLTPRVTAAETHLSALDEEQKVQDEHLNNLDASQTEQDTRIQAAHDLAVQAKTTAEAAQEAAEAAQSAADQAKADNTTQDGRLDALEAAQQQTAQDVANLKDGTTELPYVKKAGDTMTGALDMQNHKVTNVAAPTATSDAVNKGYVDTAVSGLTDGTTALPYVKKAGDTMMGNLDMGNYSITNVYGIQLVGDNPNAFTNSNDEAAIASITSPNKYNVLNVGAPVKDTHAATKKYVDQAVQNATGGITPDVSKLKQDVAALQESQTTQDSKISAAAQTAQTAQETAQAAKTTADQAAQDVASIKNGSTALPYIKDTGDTVTGDYDFTGGTLQVAAPTRPADAASKQYVDAAVGQATDPALTARVEALETSQTQQDTEIANLKSGTTALPYVKKTGDSMTGVLNMSNNKVTSVADPTANGDAVNKKYVDDKATETETTLKEYVDGHSGGFENAVIVGLYDMTKTGSIPREANNDYLFISLPTFHDTYDDAIICTIRNGSNQSVNAPGQQIGASTGQFTFTGNGYVMVYRVAVTPVPVDPATKFNQIDLSNYVGGLSGSTVNTASNFKAALQYILDNNTGKHFYYGTDHMGTTWYFASDTELSALSNDSYTCGNGVHNNGTAVQEMFKMNKYVEPTIEFPPSGYINSDIQHVSILSHYTGTIDGAFKYVNAAPEPNKYYDNDAEDVNISGVVTGGAGKCFAKLDSSLSGRFAFYYDGIWYYGQGTCITT